MSEESYVTECLIIPRQGDETLFTLKTNGEVIASLRRYAIVPLEEYEKLLNLLKREPKTPDDCLSE